MWQPNRRQLSLPRLFFFLTSVSVLFIGGILLLVDLQCAADIEGWWAQPYPNAKTVDMQYDLFRARALGETRWILETSDDEQTVRKFYQELTLEVLDSGPDARLSLGGPLYQQCRKTRWQHCHPHRFVQRLRHLIRAAERVNSR